MLFQGFTRKRRGSSGGNRGSSSGNMEDTADTPSTLGLARLEAALREAEPASMLLPSWLLEKIIAADREIRAPLFSIPHDESHVISRDRLIQLVSDEELPLPADTPDEPTLVLLARPDNDWLTNTPAPQALLAYWRLLFHAEVDGLLRDRRVDGTLDAPSVQRRIERLGRGAFREAVYVLHRERQLTTTADDAEAYAEFAATYLELLHFEPWMLHWHFPAADAQRVLAVLAEDVDAPAILAKTRPAGAAEPAQEAPTDDADEDIRSPGPAEAEPADDKPDSASGKRLLRRAQAAEQRGNDVRAAILRVRAARVLRTEAGKHRNGAARRVDALASRLRIALGLDESDYEPWRGVLRGLLSRADVGWWNTERRLLYDLQKACVCHEREIYSANVVEWLLDRANRPLRRPQPAQRLVTALKALRSAERRAIKARLHPHDRAVLKRLLHTAVESAAERIRTDLRPAVIKALEDGDLCPHGAVERVAQEKLVDELLDGVVRRGYLNLGNLRDAVSRNQLKLNDLSGPTELLGRDQLLRVDRKLEWALDGVYHRGEIYLRIFQRLSSVLFGTPWGRAFTRVLLIPVLGALIILEGLDHSIGIALNKLAHLDLHFARTPAVVMLAMFIVGLVNSREFRVAAARLGRRIGWGLRLVLYDFPRRLAKLPLFRFLFTSPAARLAFRYAVKPLVVTAIIAPLLPAAMAPAPRTGVLVGLYLAATLLLNSPAGRTFEQTILHALRVTLPRMTWDILVGLFRFIMHAFDRLLESVDRALYAVDEWLRFGSSHGGSSVAFRSALGVVWFYIAYVTRFVVNLLIEPQINPIKHFPVVTVSHKIILPTAYPLAKALEKLGIESVRAGTLAGTIVTCIPGIFGFLAWELKENWRLYRANRSLVLKPVRVGSHGETFTQLLRPGFHSGTLPKLFARVRKSARRARERGRIVPIPLPKDRENAQHLQEDVAAFIDRELVNLLNQHPAWADTPVAVGDVELASARIRIELRREGLSAECDEQAVLTFDQRDGYVIATITRVAWIADLPETKAELLRVALLALYKLAAVDLVTEHVMRQLPPGTKRFDIRHRHLIAWCDDEFSQESTYDLADATSDIVRRLLLRRVDVPWREWNRVWEAQTPAEIIATTGAIAPGVEVLPPECKHVVERTGAATGGFPVVTTPATTATTTTGHAPARISPASAPAPAAS
jgi:hypothetical protein